MDKLIDLPNATAWTAQQQSDVVGILSSYLQVMYVDEKQATADDFFAGIFSTQGSGVLDSLKTCFSGCPTVDLVERYVGSAKFWGTENPNSLLDIESYLKETSYTVGNSGSAYYTVDGVNADDITFIIYAREGDVIKFEPTSNSVFSNHPFEISSSQDDTQGNNNIGSLEGWDQSTYTLTVNSFTPRTLYPHCGVHSGMYSKGMIQIVENFDISNIDITEKSGGLQVKGSVNAGPYRGASGYTHTVYLKSQGGDEHTHEFIEFPNLTFYMPGGQGYHGSSTAVSDLEMFKPKSHYVEADEGGGIPYNEE